MKNYKLKKTLIAVLVSTLSLTVMAANVSIDSADAMDKSKMAIPNNANAAATKIDTPKTNNSKTEIDSAKAMDQSKQPVPNAPATTSAKTN